jgi:hypothetical protein
MASPWQYLGWQFYPPGFFVPTIAKCITNNNYTLKLHEQDLGLFEIIV